MWNKAVVLLGDEETLPLVWRSSIVNTTQGEWKSHVIRDGNGDVLDILDLYTSYVHGAM